MKYRITVMFTQRFVVEGECTSLVDVEERREDLLFGVIDERDGESVSMYTDKPVSEIETMSLDGVWVKVNE